MSEKVEFDPYIRLISEEMGREIGLLDKLNGVKEISESILLKRFFKGKSDADKESWKMDMIPAYESVLLEKADEKCKAAILQLGHNEENHIRTFLGLDRLKRITKEEPNIENYELVYLKDIEKGNLVSEKSLCGQIYCEFNADTLRPADYYGHSLSISDVIVLYDGNKGFSCYYVDDIGFEKLPDEFLSDRMKNQVLFGVDVRQEHNLLYFIHNEMELPREFEERRVNLVNNYERIFSMADYRGIILKKRETDPLLGEIQPFDLKKYDSSTQYFSIGKSHEDEVNFSIFGISDMKPALFEKGFCTVNDAIDYIMNLPENSGYYKEHPVEIVTREDLREICLHKMKLQDKCLDNKIDGVRQKQNNGKIPSAEKKRDDMLHSL